MKAKDIRKLFSQHMEKRGHVHLTPSPLVPKDDPTTLFVSAGMQQLIPYFNGSVHPQGSRLYNIQPCFRTVDINEVGDGRHTTFFEMLGNWSLGDYFKEDQQAWYLDFLEKTLNLQRNKLHFTVFEGFKGVEVDLDAFQIWRKLGIKKSNIHFYGVNDNWWSRSGDPHNMPEGEIGGPSSEVFYDFGTKHDPKYGSFCHPNCACGRFIEIGNSVYLQYRKEKDNSLSKLSQVNVDFGGGLERTLAVVNRVSNVFKTSIFMPLVKDIESHALISSKLDMKSYECIADHVRAVVIIGMTGIAPSNKQQGYVMRQLIRRAYTRMKKIQVQPNDVVPSLIALVEDEFGRKESNYNDDTSLQEVIVREMESFEKLIDKTSKKLVGNQITGKLLFDLYQSEGLPLEVATEILCEQNTPLSKEAEKEFNTLFQEHKNMSRSTSKGMFAGGLADCSEKVIKYHTATHLLHQALNEVLGDDIRQEGSNITGERLRFDFYSSHRLDNEHISKVQIIINEIIAKKLPVYSLTLSREEAESKGARAFFKEKYGEVVRVYCVGGDEKNNGIGAYSMELCGGPHVGNTGEIGNITITKVKNIGAGRTRIYASHRSLA